MGRSPRCMLLCLAGLGTELQSEFERSTHPQTRIRQSRNPERHLYIVGRSVIVKQSIRFAGNQKRAHIALHCHYMTLSFSRSTTWSRSDALVRDPSDRAPPLSVYPLAQMLPIQTTSPRFAISTEAILVWFLSTTLCPRSHFLR